MDAAALAKTTDVPEAPDVPAGTSETASLVPVRCGADQEARAVAVDTANFSSKSNFLGAAGNLRLVERFTRVRVP